VTRLLLLPDLNTNSVPSHGVELEELTSLLEKLSLATQNPFQGVEPSMGASKYVEFELDFDLNNPVEVIEDDVWDVLESNPISEAPHLSDDDYEDQNLEVESICLFSEVQTSFASIQKYLEQYTSDVGNCTSVCRYATANWETIESST
jgi:hypothetical protein